MEILYYDEFSTYTTIEDINSYVKELISQGIDLKDDIYSKCLDYFGQYSDTLVNEYLNYYT
jgi:hypothetical protein